MRLTLLIAAIALVCCGPAPKEKAEAPPPAPVKDNSARLPPLNLKGSQVVPDHLLGKSVLPGGTLGDYETGGHPYQLFVIETKSPQDAAILLLDLKGALQDTAYIPTMGGYSGTDAGKPVYSFAKGKYLAGVAGLPPAQADPIARQLAARLY